MKVKVKICGIRCIKAAKVAVGEGADFLGFNFVPTSKRYIDPALAAKIINLVEGRIKIVGIFQNAESVYVNDIASKLGLNFVQLHGNENAEYINQIKVAVIKTINVYNQLQKLNVDYFLLDRVKQGEGKMVDLKKGTQVASKVRLFLAGGLTPDNVAGLIKTVKPFAVDVAGGIETDGKEDLNKIKAFIKNAKEVVFKQSLQTCL
ncbi:phosphoribosylanthranilate isomerase [Patescibacteria group bacterium]|nr:phosphoribosylanthranilate isomerase [Patescibacteria group bacterium]